MKAIFTLLTTAFLATSPAWGNEPWKDRALDKVKEYSRIKSATWADSGALWLVAYKADIDWENVIDGIVCWKLNEAGKPADVDVLVRVFAFEGSANGLTERLGTGFCE